MRSELTGMEVEDKVRGLRIGRMVDGLGASSTMRMRVSGLKNSIHS